MKVIGLAVAGVFWLGAAPAAAQEAEAGYHPFEVTRNVSRRGACVAAFDVAGAPVSINAYGRKARACSTR